MVETYSGRGLAIVSLAGGRNRVFATLAFVNRIRPGPPRAPNGKLLAFIAPARAAMTQLVVLCVLCGGGAFGRPPASRQRTSSPMDRVSRCKWWCGSANGAI